jgi:hypothetical protein
VRMGGNHLAGKTNEGASRSHLTRSIETRLRSL